ncbi:MAG: ABC transporter permease [Canibacter sp.]
MTITASPQSAERAQVLRRHKLRSAFWLGIALAGTCGLIYLSIIIGVAELRGEGVEWLFITRIPRTVSLILSGASMAMCGLIMQLLTQNRFVEPTTTGTTEWAGLGLLAAMILFPGSGLVAKMLTAVIFAFAGTLIFFAFLQRVTLRSSLIVPIVGIMLGAVVSAFSTFLALQFNLLQEIGQWFAGNFGSVVEGRYELLYIVLGVLAAIFFTADRFTVAGLGEDIAKNVGLNYRLVLLLGITMVAVATGVVTVIVGALPFLGLIVPNLVSMLRGDNLRSNLPWVCLGGIWIVTICDIVGRVVRMPFEIPVSLVLGFIGAAIFIALILWSRRRV